MRSVLITGGTGFFGQGMVRRLLDEDMQRVCVYSRDEAKQAAMRAALPDPDKRVRWFVGDVRDQGRLTHAMQDIDLVIHAAALKRVEVGEYQPGEMVKTNVLGTMNVIQAAIDARVKKVVALSTDKACQPINAYGASKLMLEKLIIGANNARGANGPHFCITRYGNVAGSTGSVIPTWRTAIKDGGPILLTDARATRFWMTLDEAVDLVWNAAWDAKGGELVIPTLPAYHVGDLVVAMGIDTLQNPVMEVGLGQGEKLHERMREDGETSRTARRMTITELREALKSV